jgi:hypothetical protein
MTSSLQKAIARLQELPEERQDQLARLVLLEIEEDEKWMRSTANYAKPLQRLIDKVSLLQKIEEGERQDRIW